jgi:hypothetical protein
MMCDADAGDEAVLVRADRHPAVIFSAVGYFWRASGAQIDRSYHHRQRVMGLWSMLFTSFFDLRGPPRGTWSCWSAA